MQTPTINQTDDPDDLQNIAVMDHLIIRDLETCVVLVNHTCSAVNIDFGELDD